MSVNNKLEAERAVLAAILLDNKLIQECGYLRPEYFSLDAHQRVFSKMQELNGAGKAIDPVTLGDAVSKIEGGSAIISDLLDGAVERPSIGSYVDIVSDAAKRRFLAQSCRTLVEKLEDGSNETGSLIDRQEEVLLRLRSSGAQRKANHVKDVIPTILNEMSAQRRHSDRLIGLSTGLDAIDYMTTGIRDGEYWVIGASPSRGKTVLGAQIVAANAGRGIPSLAFTYEMTKEQFVKRMLPAYSGIPALRIKDFRYATAEQEKQVEQSAAEMGNWPFWVCDPEGMTAQELASVAKLHIRRHGVKLIVVDYLQIIDGTGDIRERVGMVSNTLRSLAKSEKVAVVALSQLRRPMNESDRPTMFHLKETGDIEAHAHTILLIYRPKGEQSEWTGEDEIIVAKQREGLVGSEAVTLNDKSLWFCPREVRPVEVKTTRDHKAKSAGDNE